MAPIKNILFPFDSEVKSSSSFDYALDVAQKNKSHLIFLHTVRLNKDSGTLSGAKIRQRVSDRSFDLQEVIKSHSNQFERITYEFHNEIGFFSSRVMLKIQEYPIDLLLIEQGLLAELNGTRKLIECPIMVIPPLK